MPRRRNERIELGLEILDATRKPGHCYSYKEIAAYAGCTWQNIWYGEQAALAKMRAKAAELQNR